MKDVLARIAQEIGTPCYVYFIDQVHARIESIRQAFAGQFGVSYAMKSNPHPAILRRLMDRVDTLDISSGGELATARKVGWPAERISFTGPGKRRKELEAAVDYRIGEVILESLHEARQLDEIARRMGRTQDVLIRVAPHKVPRGFGTHMTGKASQFGIDEEVLDSAVAEIRRLPNLRLCGFHIYSGSQCLKPDAIAENYEIFLDIFQRACSTHDITPKKLIFGSGIGVPYNDSDQSVELAPIAERIVPLLKELKRDPRYCATPLLLETGRFLVGEAGVYLTRVVTRKESRGSTICVMDGGMNHHLAAAGHMGMVIHRPYPMFKVWSERPDGPEQPFDLYGCLCTSIDHLGKGVTFPGLDVGDVIGIRSSGAYGVTASPIHFISHEPPREVLVEGSDGQLRIEVITPPP
jgi:diaminopimelate decarboxylase